MSSHQAVIPHQLHSSTFYRVGAASPSFPGGAGEDHGNNVLLCFHAENQRFRLPLRPPGELCLCLCVCPEGKWAPALESIANVLPHPQAKTLNIISFRLISEWLRHNVQLNLISRNSRRSSDLSLAHFIVRLRKIKMLPPSIK